MILDTQLNRYLAILKQEKILLKNAAFMTLAGLASAVFSFGSNIIFSRFLGPSGFGVYKIAIGLAIISAIISDLGLKSLITRFIAEFEEKKEPGNTSRLIERALMVKAGIIILILVIASFFTKTVSQIFFRSDELEILVWPTLLLFIVFFMDITVPILSGYQKFKLVALISCLVPFLQIIFGLPLAFFMGIRGLLIASALAVIAGSIPGIPFILRRVKRGTKLKTFNFRNAVVTYGLPVYFANIPSYIFIVIIPILSLFYTQKQIGYYGFSLSFFAAAQLIPLTLANVMFPKVAQLNSRAKSPQAKKTFERLMIIYTPIAIFGSLVSIPTIGPIVNILAPAFLPATRIIIYQTIASFIIGYFLIAIYFATATRKFKIATALNWLVSISFGSLAFYITNLTK